ncbi:FAD-dependent oxidoreductase [Cellulomonas hominis]
MTTTLTRGIDPDTRYDVLVIGGGITGAAIAYDAARRGLSVALAEQGDFGGATSAATGKLIHGGLRYLKNLELRLVRESLAERRVLSTIAPGLVYPIGMVLPDPGIVEHLGLTVYDVLSFDRNRVPDPSKRIPAHRTLSRAELDARGLAGIRSGILYHDAMMVAPERLTVAFVRSAVAHGAHVANHCRVDRVLVRGGRVEGAVLADTLADRAGGATAEVRARVVVNAAGPWAHSLLAGSGATAPAAGPRPAVRSEGIYLVTRQVSDTMVLYVTPHGHFSFAPWRGHSLIGPTETSYRGRVEDWRLTRASITDFLAVINATGRLPQRLGIEDVVAAYGGLRPLTETTGEDTYRASRASESVDHTRDGIDGLLTATGGKYTTARAFAAQTVARVERKLGRRPRPSTTADVPLDGYGTGHIEPYVARATAAAPDFPAATVQHLARHYGTDHRAVLDLARERPELGAVLDADGELLAQAVFAVRHELALTLTDVLLRRTGLGTLGDPGDAALRQVAGVVAAELGWDPARTAHELDEARRAVRLPE